MHWFLVLERNLRAREVAPGGRDIWIGRTRDFPIALRDRWVSRRHAVVRVRKGRLFLEDLGSTTGTIVNGRKLNAGESVELQDGDVILCGSSSLVCRFEEERPGARLQGDVEDECAAAESLLEGIGACR